MKCSFPECPNEVTEASGFTPFCTTHLHAENMPVVVAPVEVEHIPVFYLCTTCGKPTTLPDDGQGLTVYHNHHTPPEPPAKSKKKSTFDLVEAASDL